MHDMCNQKVLSVCLPIKVFTENKLTNMTYVTTNATLSWRYLLLNPSSLLPLPLDESLGIRAILDPELVTDLARGSLSFLILY